MKFLDNYPSVFVLERRHPGIMKAINPDRLIKLDYEPPGGATLAQLGLSSHNAKNLLLQAVPPQYLYKLKQRYTEGEILIGLRVLFGRGKGENSSYSVEFKNGVILKYGSRKTEIAPGEQRAIAPSDEVHNKIARGVTSAKKMARQSQKAIAVYCDDFPGSVPRQRMTVEILKFHFGRGLSEKDLPVLRDISRKYGTIARSLEGHIIIADDVGDARCGSVRTREYDARIPRLSHKTLRSTRTDFKTGVEYFKRTGNIHINFNWAEKHTVARVAKTIVHEASHKFCGTLDHAYGFETDKYSSLSRELSQQNADTYALAAASFGAGKVIKLSREIEWSTP